MEKAYHVKFYIDTDKWEGEQGHTVVGPDVYFSAHNMCECPEDATVYRDLFNGNDYIEALETGMKLAQMGYTSIEVEYIDKDEDEE